MRIVCEGHSGYGNCWIEENNGAYYVVTMNGRSRSGYYSSLASALAEFVKYCPNYAMK